MTDELMSDGSAEDSRSALNALLPSDQTMVAVFFIMLLIGWYVDFKGLLHFLGAFGFFFFLGRSSKQC